MSVKVRFAPSPTGRLHVGNGFVALHNWLLARKSGGHFLLRLDDTDRERSTEAFAEAIRTDLTWLGLHWDETAAQSARSERYAAAAHRLRESGRLYPCYETEEELALKRKAALSAHRPPIYDRAALSLSAADRARLEAEGRRPHWRFLLERGEVAWTDLVRGPQHVDEASQSDPVLIRADGSYLYTLPSVVDDIEFTITDIVRGNDHVTNTGAQIQLFRALGATPPRFGHLPLLTDASGEGLSKRLGSLSLGDLRDQGLEPLALAAYLARIGTGEPMRPIRSLEELAGSHDLSRYGSASPRFDPAELRQLNAKHLHEADYAGLADRLKAAGVDEALWQAIRGNLATLAEAGEWAGIVHGPLAPVGDDPVFLAMAAESLPPEPWDETSWPVWTKALGAASGRKGPALFKPLRLALTGRDHGPEMRLLLPLLGAARVRARLGGRTA